MKDTFRHKGLRQILVDELRGKGILEPSVLEMINSIPRHLFMDNAFVQFAYLDKAFPIGSGQTISQPYTVAFQTELLQLNIERQKELFKKTKAFLPTLGYNCNFYYGDGYKGLVKFAPFDKIIVTCGAPQIPEGLIKQLKVGGRMVAPIGSGNVQVMHLIEKLSETETKITTHGEFSFVPMLNNKN